MGCVRGVMFEVRVGFGMWNARGVRVECVWGVWGARGMWCVCVCTRGP